MKKLLIATAVVASLLSAPAMADGRHRGGHHGHHGHHGWVAPLIGGAIIGGVIANQYYRPAPPPPVVYVEPQPQYYTQREYCRPIEVIDQYGYRYWTQECWRQ